MHPVLFQFGNLSFYTYGLLVAIGFLLGIALAMKEARRMGEDPEVILDLAFYLLLAGIIGSRLFYVIENFASYRLSPLDILKFWKGGLTFYGGLIPALMAGIWYVKKHNLRVLKILDIIAPSAAIGHAVGRLGCFSAGCCYGRVCDLPWAVVFTDPKSLAPLGVSLHPTQIYSSLNAFFIFLSS
jgi:phosphatidylglycerol:prolipoprotein diacylglycerol transferase